MYLENIQKYKQTQSAFQPTRDSVPSPLLVDLLSKERVGVELTQGIRNILAAKGGQTSEQPIYAAGAA